MIYYFVIGILALFSFYNLTDLNRNRNKYLRILSFLMILVVGGLRYKVGADWDSYKNIYYETINIADIFNAREEKLFMFFLYISKKIINSYSFFVFIFFLVSFYIKYNVFKKYSSDIFLSLIIYFYTLFLIYDVNGIRQGMALGLVLFSIRYILNKELLQFLVIISIATLFHTSAIIFIPFYWLANFTISKKIIIVVIISSLIISIPIRMLIEQSSYMQLLLTMDSFSHYSFYIENNIAGRKLPILSIAVFQRLFIFSLFIINFDKIKASDELKRLLLNGYFVSILLFVFLSFSADLAARGSFYYKSLETLLIPFIITSQNKLINRMLLFIIIILFAIYGTYRLLEIPYGGLIPYNLIKL